jgi:CheY-like chemotaxis protein
MKPLVLAVDDNSGDLQILEEALADAGINVRFYGVYNVADAVLYLFKFGNYQNAQTPRVVFLDLHLTGTDTFKALELLRDHPERKNMAIIVISGSISDREREQCMRLGANRCIVKPSSIEEAVAQADSLRPLFETPQIGMKLQRARA